MLRYIIKRLLQMVVVLLGVVLFVFILSRASGDPIPQLLGENYTQADYDAMYVELGFDRPLVVQYFDYVIGIITEMDLTYGRKELVGRSKRPLTNDAAAEYEGLCNALGE